VLSEILGQFSMSSSEEVDRFNGQWFERGVTVRSTGGSQTEISGAAEAVAAPLSMSVN
jgi:hypothetical protein